MISSVDIAIPVLNESSTLREQILHLLRFLELRGKSNVHYTITIADNGSSDSTLQIARKLAEDEKDVRVVSVGVPGVGLALKEAWSSSKCEYVGYMDLDFSTDLLHLLDVQEILDKEFDCIFGSRLLPGSLVTGRTRKREITSKCFNRLLKLSCQTSLSDAMCGFKFLKREKLNQLFSFGATSNGWFFCTELTLAAQLAELQIFELPVRWADTPESKVKIPSLTLQYIRDIIKFKSKSKRNIHNGEINEFP